MTKKEVTAIIHSFGCEANYQGSTHTMFINGARKGIALLAIQLASKSKSSIFITKLA